MWKRKYKRKNYSSHNAKQQEEFALGILLIAIIFIFLKLLFWLWIILGILLIIYVTHKINEYFDLYNTKYYYWAIITSIIALIIILLWWNQIAYNMWKINKTFLETAIEITNYIKLKSLKWKVFVEPNIEGIMQKSVIDTFTSTWNNLK
jgi:energy-coupling factor transporter transmembrane protein EcfT